MTNQDRKDMIECVAEGVRRALIGLKLVEEVEHPLTRKPVVTKTLAQFMDELSDAVGVEVPRKSK